MEKPLRKGKSSDKIYFLKAAKNSDNLNQAYASLSREFFSPEWIELKGVKKIAAEHPGAILVIDSIDSREFSKVRKICKKRTNCDVRGYSLRIFTAYALLSINPSRIECLPESRYPIISTCMKTLRVAISGFGPKKTREISRKLISMGASYQHSLLRSASVLVSNSWTSLKVMCWRKSDLSLPVVTSEWVDRCYEMREDIKDAKAVIDRYRLPVFQGMCFCVSGFDTKERTKICKVVRNNGGTYEQGLYLTSYKFDGEKTQSRSQIGFTNTPLTTHLIVAHKEGPKYENAMALSENEIHIVNYDWFLVSRTKGLPQIESDPRYSARDHQVMKELKKKALEKKQRAVLSCSQSSDNTNNIRQRNIVSQDTPSTSPLEIENLIAELEKLLNSTLISDISNIFNELSFFICGLNPVHQSITKKLITRLGGTVYTDLVSAVTHVIIGPTITSKEALNINRHDEKIRAVAKVNIEWIVGCVRGKSMLPESLDLASSKLLGRINSTQDLDPKDKQEVIRARAEPKATDMNNKFKELEESSGNRNINKNIIKKGLRIGGTTKFSPFRITKKSHNESIPCSIPVEYQLDSIDC